MDTFRRQAKYDGVRCPCCRSPYKLKNSVARARLRHHDLHDEDGDDDLPIPTVRAHLTWTSTSWSVGITTDPPGYYPAGDVEAHSIVADIPASTGSMDEVAQAVVNASKHWGGGCPFQPGG
jgi:hypothetical protein